MLVDANVLLYSADERALQHTVAAGWLRRALEGDRRVGLPWQTIGAFLRIATHPRVFARPLAADRAWSLVEDWLASPVAWVPPATERTVAILGDLLVQHDLRANLVTDAQLAALALEHGVAVVSFDSDFARFSGVRWINPAVA